MSVGLYRAGDSFALSRDVSVQRRFREAERRCSDCWPKRREALARDIQEAAIEKLEQLRESGEDPAHTQAANRKRAESVSEKYALRKKWVEDNAGRVEAERERFKTEIFPQLAEIPVRSIARVCDCSLGYASKIRTGEYVPHPMHNAALDRLLQER